MRRARCHEVRSAKKQQNRNLTEQILGSQRSKRTKARRKVVSAEQRLKNHNTYRTMCVRACDGFFFPVSFSTTSEKFSNDANACNVLCPGVDMRLYIHRTSGQTSTDMVSVNTGKPYSDLSTAFSYKKRFNPSCRCNFKLLKREKAPNQSRKRTIASDEKPKPEVEEVLVSLPTRRIDRGQDPETFSTMIGDLTLDQIADLQPVAPQSEQVSARQVRVIGEAFFPSQ